MPDRILRVRYRCKTESICTSRDISEICTWKKMARHTLHTATKALAATALDVFENPDIFLFFYILKTLPPASYVSSYAAFLLR